MGRIFDSKTATSIRNQIHDVLFGQSGPVGSCSGSIYDVRALSQEFSLASPAGGGAMLAIHALGHQTRQARASLRS